ncbi:uncharacterized protein LOC114522855 isoform X2 [Dendronephthya gigantea]|uniref:uncharacterized protein LOC114522855 isoform X2 n=1 Tax=Dendronephthya gigantea TaxID=151771 RepID=UPI00106CBA0D|nr:uncharacterized protein LOC114522855 isoform X2 [Dendronephthya gigantea]
MVANIEVASKRSAELRCEKIVVYCLRSAAAGCFCCSDFCDELAWLPKIRKIQSQPRASPMGLEDENSNINEDILESEDLMAHPGQFLRLKTARKRATMISEFVKLLATPFITYLVTWLFHDVEGFDLLGGFKYLGEMHDQVFAYFLTNIFISFLGYILGIIACSMALQKISFAFPITLMTPISFFIALGCEKIWSYDWLFDHKPPPVSDRQLIVACCVCCAAFVGQFASTTYYIWRSQDFIMAKESQLFWVPTYNAVLLEQSLLLNRKNEMTDEYFVNQNKLAKDSCIFICTTMYHEADYEMEQLLHSIRRVDIARQRSMRRIESHIWFDGAVKRNTLNSYVLQLISLVNKTLNVKVGACTKLETPYGMELRWRLPGGMNFHIHLKDNVKVKNKKRWSQVMYMSYVLDFRMKQLNALEDDTYILTTDADIRFDVDSVEALLDLLMRDPNVGAVCGRTHPLGHGPMVWYQMFDYAIGHWLQKVANHVLGSVLCCPGCFSVYRAKALRDVLSLYSSSADRAIDFLTKDMGEDRWLCTLLVQAGWRLEYCAAAENFTYVPDDFDEFFKQRRRWIPSTLANLALLISESDITTKNNDSMSFPFILYQAANVFATLISPATVILIMVGGLQYGWKSDPTASLVILLIITFGYGLLCLYTSQDFQLLAARVLTLIFSLIMSAAFIGVLIILVASPEGESKPTSKPATTSYPPLRPTRNKTKLEGNQFALPTRFNQDLFILSKKHGKLLFRKPEFFASKNNSNGTNPKHKKEESVFYDFPVSSWYFFGLLAVFFITAACHPTEIGCLVHGVWYLLCLPSGYLFLIVYSICNLTDRSWGTRENKVKTANDESLTKIITDKLKWLCRGCKDPVQEPAAQPIPPVNDINSNDESSTESDNPPPPKSKGEEKEGDIEDDETTSAESGESSSSLLHSPYSPSSHKPMKSALKKISRPASPAAFRFPGEDGKRSVHFQAKLPTFKTHILASEWLDGKMKQYIPNFEENGYDDTSFISGMTEQELKDIGIETRGHRKKLLREIEQLPVVELDNNVPDNVDIWLTDLGLHEYWLNFKRNSYDNPKALEDLKVMNQSDLNTLLNDDFEIWKSGHVKKLTLAIRRLQYPSAIERKIREARLTLNRVPLRSLKDDNDGIEHEFWTRLRELRLLPESKAFGQYSELADKLAELRNSVVVCLVVANLVWIILIFTLTLRTQLNVADTNPLGLGFLIVFGVILVIQFITMLWHRVSTVLHFVARAPFRAGEASLKGWAFDDDDLPPAPSDEELRKIRAKRIRQSKKWRSQESLLKSGEHTPLLSNSRLGSTYSDVSSSRSKSPHPV